MMPTATLRRLVSAREGAVAIETALVSSIFAVFLVSIFEFGIMLFAQDALQAAAADLAANGRAAADPASVLAAWREDGSFPFAGSMDVEFACYSALADLLMQTPLESCSDAHVVEWSLVLDWRTMTPIMQFVLGDGFNLSTSGVSYR